MKVRYFKKLNGDYARLVRFTFCAVTSPNYGKYYVDLHDRTGASRNDAEVPYGVSLIECEKWLSEHKFEEI